MSRGRGGRGRGYFQRQDVRLLDAPTGFHHLDHALEVEDATYMTFMKNMRGHVKVLFVDKTPGNKYRLVGPEFHTVKEAMYFAQESSLGWPSDQTPMLFSRAREFGLLNAWREVWDLGDLIPLEDEDDFIENHNSCSSYFVVPGWFSKAMLEQAYSEPQAFDCAAYQNAGPFYVPNAPATKAGVTASTWGDPAEVSVNRRVYGFFMIHNWQERAKIILIRSRADNDRFYMCSPEFDGVQDLMEFYFNSRYPMPNFDFDAKWAMYKHADDWSMRR